MRNSNQSCFHCGESLAPEVDLTVTINTTEFPVCCNGCKAVAEFIEEGQLGQFYRHRDSNSKRVDEGSLQRSKDWQAFDQREQYWGEKKADNQRSLGILIEGMHCAACIWLLRTALLRNKGVTEVQIDLASGFARILWSPESIKLSKIMGTMQMLGYEPHMMNADSGLDNLRKQRNKALIRLLVAGLGMMQVMTYAVGLYAGDFAGISADMRRFLEGISLLVATPVVFFSGQTFFIGAYRSLKLRKPGMDVPVALALLLAWSASIYNYLRGEGALYFDSVVMFVFLLLLARFVEFSLRRKTASLSNALARLLPEIAYRLDSAGTGSITAAVPIADLVAGDLIMIPKGQTIPVDGEVVAGKSQLDESFLSGESLPTEVAVGSEVLAGSINLGDPISIKATACGEATAISTLGRTLLEAQLHRPAVAEQADKIASWFVTAVLMVTISAWLVWRYIDPSKAFEIALATLVVTCPCALSLATPATLAAASKRLMKAGLVIVKANAIEVLANIQRVVFDKTGTLTRGQIQLEDIQSLRADWSSAEISKLATALERKSEHPLASAFAGLDDAGYQPEKIKVYPGEGIEGHITGQVYRLGKLDFAQQLKSLQGTMAMAGQGIIIYLADKNGLIASLKLTDTTREEAKTVIGKLHQQSLQVSIVSGDSAAEVARVAGQLDITQWHARQLPAQKLELIRGYQQQGEAVLMVGDGINDAPVLAGANVSMAMNSATHLAKSSADFIVTINSLAVVPEALEIAKRCQRVIRQNLGFSLLYNLLAVPLAVSGVLSPWMAVIGMSLSSLVVVINASRLAR